jgi:predicted nucleic acid-binding protein
VVALLDSAAVAGFLDRDDVFHEAADATIRALAGRERLIVSVITYAELLTGVGLGHHAGSTVRGFFADLVDEVHVVDRTIADRAAEMRAAKSSLRMPDALILATADVHDAGIVITADHRWTDVLVGRTLELLRAAEEGA